VDVDAFKSNSIFTKIAKPIITMLQPQLKKLTVDIAFMMQAHTASPQAAAARPALHLRSRRFRRRATTDPRAVHVS